MLTNIPAELRALPQWVCAGPDKLPVNPRTGRAASVVDPSSWATFDEAVRAGMKHVGFVLAEWDPYAIIDLDNKPSKPCTPEQWARHQKILEAFVSYTEKSASGTGYHVIIKGKVPSGVHRDNVEVYSSARYMICTGNVVRQSPITDHQSLLDMLFAEMKPQEQVELEDHDEVISDADLVEMGANAANGDKFNALCAGQWNALGYESQSEADFALLSMFAFYSQNNEQVMRLFRLSALGKREKAQRDEYINRALRKIRANEPPPVDIEAIAASLQAVPAAEASRHQSAQDQQPPSLPPGLVGELASYFYETAVRPVPEIALTAAIAISAGVSGRSFNVSGTGLNQYLVLLARTGSGKEGVVSGIDTLLAAVKPKIPIIDQFVGPSAFASGQALIRVLDERPCFVSVLGEFGLTLQQLCAANATAPQVMLRRVLLDLYTKSGWTRSLRSSVYADVEKNTKVIQAPNVTILGESTQETFFNGLDVQHIAEGLIPRFSIVEYTGQRPPRNHGAGGRPSDGLTQRFADFATVALSTMANNTCCPVQLEPRAQKMLDEFDAEADAHINGSNNEVEVQLWNRAHLKALKMSALLAVGCNPLQPIATVELARWALDFVRRDVSCIAKHFSQGDVGGGDNKLHSDLRRILLSFLQSDAAHAEKYGCDSRMRAEFVVPHVYIQRRTSNLTSFKAHARGSAAALREAIQAFVENGYLIELLAPTIATKFGSRGKAYSFGPNWKQFIESA